MNREIPIIADTYVDREFGTGVVKITPAHDPNDFEVGKRHNLPEIDVLTDDAHMNEAAGKYAGLERFVARARIIADLEELGLIDRITEHTHSVGTCDRCKAIVEPRLSTQWFMKMKPLAEAGEKSGARWIDRSRSRQPADDFAQLARKYSRLVHLAAALVGPPDSHLALRRMQRNDARARFARRDRGRPRPSGERAREMPEVRRRRSSRRKKTSSTRGSAPACGRSPLWAGPTTPPISARITPRAC